MRWSLFILLIGAFFSCKAVPSSKVSAECFQVGNSSVTLEPDNSIFSLALAGYGAPIEGRFTLEWIARGDAPDVNYLTGDGERLYAADSKGGIRVLENPLANGRWRTVESSLRVKFLTLMQGKLYAVDETGRWFTAKPSVRTITWENLSSPLLQITSLTSVGKLLYATTSGDDLFEGRVNGAQISWMPIGAAQTVIGMAGYKERLFALTSNQLLWRRDASARHILWTKIGYNNGLTYDVDLRQIAVASDRLFAIGMDGRLYVAQHKTQNNLTARALAVKKGKKTAVIVGTDLTGFDYAFVNKVKSDIFRRTGIPADAVLINASHTHFAPVTQGWYSWQEPNQYPDERYMEEVIRPNIVKAVCEAVDRLKPATLSFGRGQSIIGANRCLSGEEALYDPTLDVVKVESTDGTLSDVLFMASCHPVLRNAGVEGFTINGNYPAAAKEFVVSGSNAANAIFLQGCAGDVNPIYDDFRTMGNILGGDVLKVLDQPMRAIEGEISCSLDSLLVEVAPWSEAQIRQFRADNLPWIDNLEAAKNVRWADIMLKKYQEGTMPAVMPVYIHTINIGNWKLVGLSREAVTQYGIEIRRLWPDQPVSVVGYTNDVSSYLPAASHIKAHTYEGDNSFFWYSQPSLFPEDILERVVRFIKQNNR